MNMKLFRYRYLEFLLIFCDENIFSKGKYTFGRSKINTRFHEFIVNFYSNNAEKGVRYKNKIYTDHHWLFERNIYTHFQYITTFNNNMRSEKLRAWGIFLRRKENFERRGYQRAALTYWGRSNIFISSLYHFIEDKKVCMICFTIVLPKNVQTHAHTIHTHVAAKHRW